MHGRCGSDPNLIQRLFEARRPFELLEKEVRACRPFIVGLSFILHHDSMRTKRWEVTEKQMHVETVLSNSREV
jgi:hypothetical protein